MSGQASPTTEKTGGVVIGIDLGTTYSCVAIYRDARVEIIPNEQGNRITPSMVAFTHSARLVGDAAKNQMAKNAANTIFGAKRILGRSFSDPSVQRDMKMWPFEVVSRDGKPMFSVEYKGEKKEFAPEEISAMVLMKMKQIASSYLGENVTDAVVTVPAYFNDGQRRATVDAGKIAGLNVMRTLSEPTAASLAYGLHKVNKDESHVIVFDLGGGTFDVSLLALDDGIFEVLATSGDTHLGGEDFDERVMKHFVKMFKKKHGVDIRENARGLSKLRREVEKAKRALSSTTQVRIEIESIANGLDFSETLTRARFEELNNDLFRKTLAPLKRVLSDAKMKKSEIDEIVLVGGSTRIPMIQEMVKKFFNGKELNRGVNPDEAVAHGAAVQGAILSGNDEVKGVVFDVTPLSYGIETVGGVMTRVIERNSHIPARKMQTFSTYQDSQTSVVIQVYQGERTMTKDNILLGKFELSGIPAAPRGVPQIEVTFDVDSNGILEVTAVEKKSGEESSIRITADQGRLSEEEVAALVEEARKYAEEDEEMAEKARVRSEFEQKVFGLRNEIREEQSRLHLSLSEEDRETVEQAIEDASEWLEMHGMTSELDGLREKKGEFEEVVDPILKEVANGGQYEPPKGDGEAWESDEYEDHVEL